MFVFPFFLLFSHIAVVYTTVNFLTGVRERRNAELINENIKCNTEIKTICNSNDLSSEDDFSILECLSLNPSSLNSLSEDCQHVIWEHTRRLIQDEKVKSILEPSCQGDLEKLNCKTGSNGNYLKCILSTIDDVQDINCRQLILRLESVAFTDYLWISSFLQHCTKDISNLKCGRIDSQTFSQFKTISCLQNNILSVQDDCKKEVFHLSELQSDNIRLDADLYMHCASDHKRYCSKYFVGGGRVFPCLLQQLHEDRAKLEVNCRQHLLRRQKLVAHDYVVSKGLLRACKEDIKKSQCRKSNSEDKTIRLAQILLCLENMVNNGTKINVSCKDEIVNHRRMLMEDYRLSPEIVSNCNEEITSSCKGLKVGGKTIHCLMELALHGSKNNPDSWIKDVCLRALEDLVKETDAGENWTIDPVLHQACDAVVKVACKGLQGGGAKVISCLLDKLGTDFMNEECEKALIQIQYFIARDFRLDPQLYRECKKDAKTYCHYTAEEDTQEGPSYSHAVLPCLYRQQSGKLTKNCLLQIRRVMRQRAVSVNLQPEIEGACFDELGSLCSINVKKGEEIQCLQDHFENLQSKCQEAVEYFTEIEAQHVDINPYINKYCSKIIENVCKMQITNDEGEIMDCLIENKNSPLVKSNHACFASIEHFQLITLKDYRFSYKFKMACKSHAMKLCYNAKSKSEVVACLSANLLNSTIHGVRSSIPKDCKQQLRSQIFQQRENINLNPALQSSCSTEIKKFCNINKGSSQVQECLQTVPHDALSTKCEKQIFKMKQMEIYDNSVDYALLTTCAATINLFCPNHDKETVLDCLKINKNEKGFDKKCLSIVIHRLVEKNTNSLLNPSLQEDCDLDINKLCKNDAAGDAVIKCLKTQFKLSRLSNKCEKTMADMLRDQALNVDLNPLLKVVCKNEIGTICKFSEEDAGKVEECLKTAFMKKNIPTPECQYEVANMIEESQVDIEADPLLQSACALDLLTYCNNVTQGNGRRIQCLKSRQTLTPNCKHKLKERFEMYRNAIQVAPLADFQDLYQHVVSSPSKSYFVIFFVMVLSGIFVIGLLCGRITKNKYKLLKNK